MPFVWPSASLPFCLLCSLLFFFLAVRRLTVCVFFCCRSVCLSDCALAICQSAYLRFVFLVLSVAAFPLSRFFVWLVVCLLVCLSVCLALRLFGFPAVWLSFCLFVCLVLCVLNVGIRLFNIFSFTLHTKYVVDF